MIDVCVCVLWCVCTDIKFYRVQIFMDFMGSSFTQKLPLNGLLNCFIIFNLDGELLFHLELSNYCIRIYFVVWDLLFRRFKILLALSTHV